MSLFYERIKELRTKHKLTQKNISQSIGISERNYISLENNHTRPSLDTAIKFADFFEVSLDYLTGRSDDSMLRKKEM